MLQTAQSNQQICSHLIDHKQNERSRRRTVDRIAARAPIRKLLVVEAFRDVRVPSVLPGHGATKRMLTASARSNRIAGTCLVRLMASMLFRAVR
jgi:hypothetical protein